MKQTPEKICHSIKGSVDATDFSRTYIFEAIKDNRLKTFKRGSRRFILHEDLVAFIHQEAADSASDSEFEGL